MPSLEKNESDYRDSRMSMNLETDPELQLIEKAKKADKKLSKFLK